MRLSVQDIADTIRLLNLLLSGGGAQVPVTLDETLSEPILRQANNIARSELGRRRHRLNYFAASMFGEPAWDILLALYMSDTSESRNTISRLAETSGAPMTTVLRWVDYLEQARLVARRPSSTDRRVVFVELTAQGRDKLTTYLNDRGPPGTGVD
jgi:DNA-binding MarR family transcriptional regulator